MNLDGYALPVKKLKGTEPVESLDLSSKSLGVNSAIVIASLIGVNASLTSINLKDNRLGDVGWCAIFDALRDNPQNKIKEWDLERQGINSTVAKSLADYVAVSGSLTSCDVRDNQIVGDGASQLSAAVLTNTKIEKFNEIPIKEMRADSLTELDLKSKNIGVEGGMVVAGLVPVMGSLTKLSLAANMLREEGTKAICQSLKANRTLKELDISGSYSDSNIGGAAGAKHVADMLHVNGSLTSVC